MKKKHARKKLSGDGVGFGKPPKESQFKPGKSGNPSGRPKKVQIPEPWENKLKEIVQEEAYRMVEVQEDGKIKKLPLIQVLVRSMCAQGIKGKASAGRTVLEFLRVVEDKNAQSYFELYQAMVAYKGKWKAHINESKARGIENPEVPLPHPDDIRLDELAGQFDVHGPMTRTDKERWDSFSIMREKAFEEIDRINSSDEAETEEVRAHLQKLRDRVEKITELIGDYDHTTRNHFFEDWED